MTKLRICIVGMGRHGRGCFLALQWLAKSGLLGDLELEISFCSSNPQVRSGNWKGLPTPNLGIDFPNDGMIDFSEVTIFERPEEVEADLVWICLPTSEHRRLAEFFLAKGINVLLEKPVALNMDDALAVLAAARKSTASLMIAHELPFFEDFAYLRAVLLRSDPVTNLQLIRQISTADETAGPQNVAKFGGPVIDLHIHCAQFILGIFGMPRAVMVQGVGEGNYLSAGTTVYEYDACRVTATWGVSDEPGFNFRHGFNARFASGAQLHYVFNVFDGGKDCFAMPPMTVHGIGTKGKSPVSATLVELPAQQEPAGALGALVRELRESVDTISSGTGRKWVDAQNDWRPTSPLCPTLGVSALQLCLSEKQSWQTGQRVALL